MTTTLGYDELNRVTSKTYSDTTPAVTLFYDANQPASVPVGYNRGSSIGRLTAVTTSTTGSYYGYDALGRTNQSYQRLDGADYAFSSYVYNKAGGLTSESYPSGRSIGMSYDTAGRIASVTNNGANVASGIGYASHGAISSETLGNGLLHQIGYNNRLQPTSITLGSVLTLAYDYGLTTNNGNLLTETITPGSGQTPFVQSFTYDNLNRLQSAVETVSGAQTWKQTNGFDRYGNRWIDSLNTTGNVMGPLTSQSDLSASNNRIVKAGYSYDAAGNMTAEPGKTYTFDGENKIATAVVGSTTTTYVYDGEGRRVKKTVGATVTRMVYNAAGELIAEYNGAGSLTKEYIYRGSELIATVEPTNGIEYATADHLGSPRLWTNSSGQVVTGGRHDYLPFGEELFSGLGGRSTGQGYAASTQADGQRKQFTSKERDSETNLDYFGARYCSSAAGRFTSTDPIALTSARLLNPQEINLYAYVSNNPLRLIDPDGEDTVTTKTERYSFDIIQSGVDSQGNEWRYQVTVTVTETTVTRTDDNGNITQQNTTATATAVNSAQAINTLSEGNLSRVANVASTIATEAARLNVPRQEAFAIAQRESFFGTLDDGINSLVNPMKITRSSGRFVPSGNLVDNIEKSLLHYLYVSQGRSLESGFQRYGPGAGNPGGNVYGTAVAGQSNRIGAEINGSIRTTGFNSRYNVNPSLLRNSQARNNQFRSPGGFKF